MARNLFVKILLLCYSQNRLRETHCDIYYQCTCIAVHIHRSTHALQCTCFAAQCFAAHVRRSTCALKHACIATHMQCSTHAKQCSTLQHTHITAHMHCKLQLLEGCEMHFRLQYLQWARFTQIKSNVYILIKCDTVSFVEMFLNCVGICLF